jgi:hypothetical protein
VGRDFLSAVASRTSGGRRLNKCYRISELWAKSASNWKHLLQSIAAGLAWIVLDLRPKGQKFEFATNQGVKNQRLPAKVQVRESSMDREQSV